MAIQSTEDPNVLWALLISRNKLIEDLCTVPDLPEPVYQKMRRMVEENHSKDKEIILKGGIKIDYETGKIS